MFDCPSQAVCDVANEAVVAFLAALSAQGWTVVASTPIYGPRGFAQRLFVSQVAKP